MPDLTITLIQTDILWENKAGNLEAFEKKIIGHESHSEIFILPEMFSTGFSMNAGELAETIEGPTVNWMKRMSMAKKAILTGSVIIKEEDSTGNRYFNRLIWMQPDGKFGFYDKRHLFAYARENEHYNAGSRRLITSVKGWRLNLLVCYDLRFPVWARQQGQESAEFDVLVYVANWPDKRVNAWKALLVARAIENQCYVVGVNRVGNDANNIRYSGESMIVDPLGEVLYSKKDAEDIFTFKLSRQRLHDVRDNFPFLRDADNFKIVS